MKRQRKKLNPAQKKKVFQTFSKLIIGAVKIWLAGSPYIVLADQVDDFINEFPNVKTVGE
jgi:hypothetical protein